MACWKIPAIYRWFFYWTPPISSGFPIATFDYRRVNISAPGMWDWIAHILSSVSYVTNQENFWRSVYSSDPDPNTFGYESKLATSEIGWLIVKIDQFICRKTLGLRPITHIVNPTTSLNPPLKKTGYFCEVLFPKSPIRSQHSPKISMFPRPLPVREKPAGCPHVPGRPKRRRSVAAAARRSQASRSTIFLSQEKR